MAVTLFALWAHPVSVLAMLGKMLHQPLILLLNWLPVALLTGAFAFAFRNAFWGAAASGLIVGVMSLINRVKLTVRGEPFVPRDISLIKEAADAAGSYDMSLPWFQVCCLVVMAAAFVVLGLLLPLKKSEDAPKMRGALVRVMGFVLCLAVLVGAVGLVYSSTDLYNSFETTEPYNLSSVNNELGFAYYFCYHFSTYKIEKPEGFDRDEAASWETGYESAPDAADVNVVFVMNEAFSDILNEDVFVFPEGEPTTRRLKDVLEDDVDESFFLSDEKIALYEAHRKRHDAQGHGLGWKPRTPEEEGRTVTCDRTRHGGNFLITEGSLSEWRAEHGDAPADPGAEPSIELAGKLPTTNYDMYNRVYATEGVAPTLRTMATGGNLMPKIEVKGGVREGGESDD